MNRRAFLSAFSTAAAAIAFDPERALWTPGARLISIPRLPAYSIIRFSDAPYIVRVWPDGRRDLVQIGTRRIVEFGKAYLIS